MHYVGGKEERCALCDWKRRALEGHIFSALNFWKTDWLWRAIPWYMTWRVAQAIEEKRDKIGVEKNPSALRWSSGALRWEPCSFLGADNGSVKKIFKGSLQNIYEFRIVFLISIITPSQIFNALFNLVQVSQFFSLILCCFSISEYTFSVFHDRMVCTFDSNSVVSQITQDLLTLLWF